MKDSDLGRPSSERLSGLWALAGSRSGRPSLRRRERKRGRGRRRSAPAHPAAQTKLRPESSALPGRSRRGRNSHVRQPCGGRTPAPTARDPAPAASTAPGHGGAGRGRARRAGVPARRCPHALGAPQAPAPRGPLLRPPGRRAAGNKGAAAAPPAAPASARTPRQPPGPARPHLSPSPRAGRQLPLDGRPGGAGASGARRPPGAALTAAAPGRRGAVGELG